MIFDTAVYTDGRRTAAKTIEGALKAGQGSGGFACIGVREPQPEELGSIADGLGVDPTKVERAVRHPRRAGIQFLDGLLCVWLACVRYESGEQDLQVDWICVLLGEGAVISLGFGEGMEVLETVHRRSERGPGRLWQTPRDVLREIVDVVFDGYDEAVDGGLDDDIVQAEKLVIDDKTGAGRLIHTLTRVVIEFYQAAEPLAEALDRLLDGTDAGIRETLSPARHRLGRVTEKLDGYRDRLSSLLGLNLTMVGQKISAWGAILIVPTLIAGVFGMNAETTFFWWINGAYGLEALLAIMVALSVVLYLLFKRSGWL